MRRGEEKFACFTRSLPGLVALELGNLPLVLAVYGFGIALHAEGAEVAPLALRNRETKPPVTP